MQDNGQTGETEEKEPIQINENKQSPDNQLIYGKTTPEQ
jgi:hypothetical protein